MHSKYGAKIEIVGSGGANPPYRVDLAFTRATGALQTVSYTRRAVCLVAGATTELPVPTKRMPVSMT